MRKFLALFSFFTLALSFSATSVLAIPNFSNANLISEGTEKTLVLPPAADNSPVISLGTALDPQSNKAVEGYAFIHYKKGFDHKSNHNAPAKNTPGSCYTYLSNSTKWKGVEPWVVNTQNARGLASDFIFNNITSDIAKWEDATDGNTTNATGVDVLGPGATTSAVLVADTSTPDGQNEIYFADVSSSGAIAVTIVWGIFSGPPFARELVEWDQIYDDIDFDWSSTGEPGKMDFENIATHELGHSVGLGDLYETVCSEETMFGYSTNGETKKRNLNSGDITGANKLY